MLPDTLTQGATTPTQHLLAMVRLLGPWSCGVGIGLLVWAPGGHPGRGALVGEE